MLLITLNTTARSNEIPYIGRSAGMGNAYISQYSVEATLHNQAGLARLSSISFSLFAQNRYLVKELTLKGIMIGIPIQKGVFSSSFYSFGPINWMESTFTIAYSRQLTPTISGGVQLNYFGMKLPEENHTISSLGAEVGFIYQFSPTLFAGIHIANPYSIPFKTSTYNEKIPWCFRLGGHQLITKELILAIEVEKFEKEDLLFKAGMEWAVTSNLYLRAGYNSGLSKLFTGIGIKFRFIEINIAFGYHQVPGITPSIALNFKLK